MINTTGLEDYHLKAEQAMREILTRIAAVHVRSVGHDAVCAECGQHWPCRTRELVNGVTYLLG